VPYLVYNFLLTVALVGTIPLLPLLLVLWPRFRPGLTERLGWYKEGKLRQVRGARPLWIHAASVGEVGAAGQLIAAIKAAAPDRKIIFSTFTDTGNAMAQRCTGVDLVLYLPLDHSLIVRRALGKFDPAALVIIETEIWPNLLHEAYKRGIPVVLLSGRVSEGAMKRYLVWPGFFRRIVRCFASLGMQSSDDQVRIIRLGAEPNRVQVTGNLKRVHPAFDNRNLAKGDDDPAPRRPLLVVGSSHAGEEKILLEVYVSLKRKFPTLQLALAPRHPERFAEVETLLRSVGMDFEKKSRMGVRLSCDRDVILIDTLGDLGKYYERADIAFVGGSLVDVGGHNLLEPAYFKKPILFGPAMANFRALAEEMKASGGGIEVSGSADLLREIAGLIADPIKRQRTGEKAYAVAAGDGAVLQRSLKVLRRYVDFDFAGDGSMHGTRATLALAHESTCRRRAR
jgi:3-deoxy-D-manno-octulosonic-acid transferase